MLGGGRDAEVDNDDDDNDDDDDEQYTTCNSPRLVSGSTRYFPFGLKVAVIFPERKSSMDVSTIPDVDADGRNDERDAALALLRMDRRSWALLMTVGELV
jgi:hypothetical protein